MKNKMKPQLIIEKYGVGSAVAVLDRGKVVDLFIDPPTNSDFYSPSTFVKAKIDGPDPEIEQPKAPCFIAIDLTSSYRGISFFLCFSIK